MSSNPSFRWRQAAPCLIAGFCLAQLSLSTPVRAGGVTIITHGYNSDVNGWITGMADRIPDYASFPGTNSTTYKVAITYGGGSYYFTTTRTRGGAPATTDSGEIIVKLDWADLSSDVFDTYASTYGVALAASQALLTTNLIGELGGHALVEFPLHLIGHSRGGSLISEMSRLLGTNGIWIDHVTSLDPRPLNNDGNLDPALYSDAPVRTYANVLFADDYWQDLGDGLFVPNGEAVAGAYVRQLYSLPGGYSSSHSDVHLWYHGTIDLATPASDTEASITGAERTNWWVDYEAAGARAGFYYSRIGNGDRLSMDQPLGPGFPEIRDGYNQFWDLGAGTAANRVALTVNNGAWPNLIRLDRLGTNQVLAGDALDVQFYYQWAQPTTAVGTVRLYLDEDHNPLNANQRLVTEFGVQGTGAASVSFATIESDLPTNLAPGTYSLLGEIAGGGRKRFLYARHSIEVVTPPVLDVALLDSSQIQVGINGLTNQTMILQTSSDLLSWQSIATNVLSSNRWIYLDNLLKGPSHRFYRAELVR